MKLTITTFLIGFYTICHSQELKAISSGYKIEGHILGLQDNSRIYLINVGQRKRIDSAVVKNNRFTMTGKLNEPALMYLYLGKSNKLADILLDNRNIGVKGNEPIYDSIKIMGSDIDMQWREWYQNDQRIGYKKYRLDKLYESLVDKKDSVNAIVAKKLSEEFTNDRINLLKGYVKRYNGSVAGALLPTLCTISNSLTKADYLEMYNYLNPSMRTTTLGKEILNLAEGAK
jgi:Domain of unknown function (DUF4369)